MTTPTRWEYKFLVKQTEKHMLLELGGLGREGWEAFALSYDKDIKGVWVWTAWIKRPLVGEPAAPAAAVAKAAPPEAAAPPPTADEPIAQPKSEPAGFDLSDGDFGFKEE